jgi:hypothetical protein
VPARAGNDAENVTAPPSPSFQSAQQVSVRTVRAAAYAGPALGGGSASHFFDDEAGDRYLVKFLGNPQGQRVLVNELVAGQVACFLGVPCPELALVQVDQWLVDGTPEIRQRTPGAAGGIHFGSREVPGCYQNPSRSLIPQATNAAEFPMVIVFDALTMNTDRVNDGNFVLATTPGQAGFKFVAIDHGHCFGHNWDATLTTKVGTTAPAVFTEMAAAVAGAQPFTGALARAQSMSDSHVASFIGAVPASWGLQAAEADVLAAFLRGQRDALPDVFTKHQNLFPNWRPNAGPHP